MVKNTAKWPIWPPAFCSASRAICPRLGATTGYAFARSCRAQNTILLASSKKAPILPCSLTKHVRALPIHPNRRPTAGTARCMHLVGGSDARGWCREAQLPPLEDSWRAVSGASEGVLSDDFTALFSASLDYWGAYTRSIVQSYYA